MKWILIFWLCSTKCPDSKNYLTKEEVYKSQMFLVYDSSGAAKAEKADLEAGISRRIHLSDNRILCGEVKIYESMEVSK